MVSEDLARQLHDRVTRGELLSEEEQVMLKNWYALQDRAEGDTLGIARGEKTLTLTTLQVQVKAALTQLTTVTKRIQKIASENKALRHEIALLRQQLAYQSTLQPA